MTTEDQAHATARQTAEKLYDDLVDFEDRGHTRQETLDWLERRIAVALRQRDEQIAGREHEARLIEADTQRGITDCSTPLFQRVRNIVEQLEAAEAQLRQREAEIEHLSADWHKLAEQNRIAIAADAASRYYGNGLAWALDKCAGELEALRARATQAQEPTKA